MPRSERNKEEIGWLKVVFAAAVALDASLIAWIVQNYGNVNRLAYRRLEELEDL